MSPYRIPKGVLRWTPAGNRKRGRHKTTRRKTVLSWGKRKGKTRWLRRHCCSPVPHRGQKVSETGTDPHRFPPFYVNRSGFSQ